MSGLRRGLLDMEEEPAASSRLSHLLSKEPSPLSRRSVAVLCLLLAVSLVLVIALAAALTIQSDRKAAPLTAAASSSSSTAAPAAASSPSSSSPASSGPSAFSSSSSALPLPFSSSSSWSGAAPPLYTVNVSIAGMDGRQFGSSEIGRIVIVMPNVFGVSPELWNLSAEIAQAGYRALAMDIFLGQPMPRSWRQGWWDEPEHFYNNTVLRMQAVVDEIRAQEGERLQSLHSVGYCFGGGVAAGMAGMERPVWSVVAAHPTFENGPLFTLGDLAGRMQGAAAFLMPVDDPQFNRESAHYLETLLSRNREAEFRLYANTSHGFAFDWPSTAWRASMRREALLDTIHWLQEHDSRAK